MFARNTLALLAAAGFVAAQNATAIATITKVVDVYTTYCPEPTTFAFQGKEYIVTAPTTLTITDCPCTVVEESAAPPPATKVPVPAPEPKEPSTEPAPPAPQPTDVPAGASPMVGQAVGWLAAAGVAVVGVLAL